MTVGDYSTLPLSVVEGLHRAAQYLACNVAEEKHHARLYSSLADKWDRNESLTAAMKLMERHGVKLTPEEEEYMGSMDPAAMIDTLVTRIPNQSKEEFQHFFLQLQLIVASASRIRCALEEGHTEEIQAALEDAERTGISSYILRMAIVQAGSEVVSLKRQHAAWVKDAEAQMSRLVRGQQDFMEAQKRLAIAREQLHMQQSTHKEKARKALLNMVGGSRKLVLQSFLRAWQTYTRGETDTNRIYEDYRERIETLEGQLAEYQAKHLRVTKNVCHRKASARDDELLAEVFGAFRHQVETDKFDRENGTAVQDMHRKIQLLKDKQSASAKQFVAKALFTSERGLYFLCMKAWLSFSEEYKREKDVEERVKNAEKKMQDIIRNKAGSTLSVLRTFGRVSATGLKQGMFMAWVHYVGEERAVAEMEEQITRANLNFVTCAHRSRKLANSAMHRSQVALERMDVLKVMHAWRHETRMAGIMHNHHSHLNAKRQQLAGVQQMFKNFAVQLETNLKTGSDTDRDFSAVTKPRRREHRVDREDLSMSMSMSMDRPGDEKEQRRRERKDRKERRELGKGGGTLSLPDIHGKKGGHAFSPNSSRMGSGPSPYSKMGNTPKKMRDDDIIRPHSNTRSGQPRLPFA